MKFKTDQSRAINKKWMGALGANQGEDDLVCVDAAQAAVRLGVHKELGKGEYKP